MTQHVPAAKLFPQIAMIGVGSMGGAILAGLRSPLVQLSAPIQVTTQRAVSAAEYAEAADVVALAVEDVADANKQVVATAKVVLLAVKPWLIHEVLRDIADVLQPGTIVVSVAAGITTASMEALLPTEISVIRAMPNTPSLIGRGVTGIASGSHAHPEALALVQQVFETVGDVLVLDEARIDALSAISGSGPAYVFLFVEALTQAALRLGFTAAEAQTMVQGTVAGAAELLLATGEQPAELRRRVTSPKGTTEQAIGVLQSGNWGELFDDALAAAIARAAELAAN